MGESALFSVPAGTFNLIRLAQLRLILKIVVHPRQEAPRGQTFLAPELPVPRVLLIELLPLRPLELASGMLPLRLAGKRVDAARLCCISGGLLSGAGALHDAIWMLALRV